MTSSAWKSKGFDLPKTPVKRGRFWKKHESYSAEFKQKAVKRMQKGEPPSYVAEQLGICYATAKRWQEEARKQ